MTHIVLLSKWQNQTSHFFHATQYPCGFQIMDELEHEEEERKNVSKVRVLIGRYNDF